MLNKKNFMKKLVMFIVALMICMIPAMVNAAEYVNDQFAHVKNGNTYVVIDDEKGDSETKFFAFDETSGYLDSQGWKVKKQKVTLSTKKFVKTELDAESGILYVTYKKPGTTKIQVKLVLSKGKKTKTLTYNFKVKTQKFVTPMEYMKFDGKDYAKKIRLDEYLYIKSNGKKKVKFTYKLKKGWKLEENRFTLNYMVAGKWKTKKIKNGEVITIKKYAKQKGGPSISGCIVNTKTKQSVSLSLEINP